MSDFLVPIRGGVTPTEGGRLSRQRATELLRSLDDLARFRARSWAALKREAEQ